jgi:ribokinase
MNIDPGPTGHANIQVTPEGENSIVLYDNTNQTITKSRIADAFEDAQPGEFLLLQNEIHALDYPIDQACKKEMRVVFNAASMTEEINALPLEAIELLITNEIEGFELTTKTAPDNIIEVLTSRFTSTNILLTLGAAGSILCRQG